MYFATLASGSSGNAILVGERQRTFIVDCGIPLRNFLKNIEMLQVSPKEIEGLVVTHEHIDHSGGVGALARKLDIPIYASSPIWKALEGKVGRLREDQKVVIEEGAEIAGLTVKTVKTSHDSSDSYGLKVSGASHNLGIATDSGMITEEMHRQLKGCDAYVLEANHDLEQLWQGPYPWVLKKRITGNRGHLSNVQTAEALQMWLSENTQKVVLAHLSEENNTPEKALRTILRILKDSAAQKRCPKLKIRVAPRRTPHELIHLGE